jgi:GNAT superfamily N-acetyltransferase
MSPTPETSSNKAACLAAVPAGLPLARLVEGSEARAYASMFDAAHAADPALGFSSVRVACAVLLRARAVSSKLVFNRVLGLGVFEPATAGHIETVMAAYAEGGAPFGVELSPAAEPVEVPAMLKAQRLRKALATQVLVRDGSAPPPRYASWTRATGLRVESVAPEQAPVVARICCENFSMPGAAAPLLQIGSCAPGWRRWLAFDGAAAVGASLSFVEDGVAWLGWTSVLPSHRGRWVHAGIVARQLEDAHAAGCDWVTTETALSSREKPDAAYLNLRNFGFQDAYERPFHIYQPRRAA